MISTKIFSKTTNLYNKEFKLYYNPSVKAKAFIVYIHGGGLIYGDKSDLPNYHIERITKNGFMVLAIDYPLAPFRKIDYILNDIEDSVNFILKENDIFTFNNLNYYLWGRSAGAYLALLLVSKYKLEKKPIGILSYYGYGFFENDWDKFPSKYYNNFPKVNPKDLNLENSDNSLVSNIEDKYHIYVYARQTGLWSSMFFDGREKYFYRDFSLRTINLIDIPIFACHAINDTDVPFAEFNKIKKLGNVKSFIAPVNIHDFDRDTSSKFTKKLLDETLSFLDKNLININD